MRPHDDPDEPTGRAAPRVTPRLPYGTAAVFQKVSGINPGRMEALGEGRTIGLKGAGEPTG